MNNAANPMHAEEIQEKLMFFVRDFANRYVGGMSGSLPIEQMQSLAACALYQITFGIRQNNDPRGADFMVRNTPLRSLQEEGIAWLKHCVDQEKRVLERVQRQRIKIPHRSYQDTLMKGIPLFFSKYDLYYAAHETPGSIDYQLALDLEGATGISYISGYLQQVNLENQFCRIYSPVDIHRLMKSFDKNYEELFENQFETVLIQSLGRIMTNQDPSHLVLTPEDLAVLHHKFFPLSFQALEEELQSASQGLLEALQIESIPLQQLVKRCSLTFPSRLQNALTADSLHTIWTVFP